MTTNFGDRVAQLREQMGIGQSELARRIGKSPQTIQKIENGGNARNATIEALIKELKTTKAYLLVGDDATSIDVINDISKLEKNVPLVEWSNIGLSFEFIQSEGLIIDNVPLISGESEGIICTKIEGGDWMNLNDDTLAYVKKDINFEDVAHDSYIVIRLNDKNLIRKLLVDGDKRIAVTTNKSMPQSEREINANEFIGIVTGFYIPT